MKNKFNIGDKVMIRTDLELGEKYGDLTLLPLMAEHCGSISEIVGIDFRDTYSCCYVLKDIYSPIGMLWIWSEEMLTSPKTVLKNKFNTGDKVRIKTDLKIGKKYGGITYCESRAKYAGKCYEVLYCALGESPFLYTLNDCRRGDHGDWVWSEQMLEKVEEEALENNKKPKFKNGDSVKVTKQFADVKAGYYQVLDVLYINGKSWYTFKGAPMIWVPEENLEINDPESYTKPQAFEENDRIYLLDKFGAVSPESVSSIISEEFGEEYLKYAVADNRCLKDGRTACAYQSWTRHIADICRFKQEKDAEFISTEDNPGYVIDFLPFTGTFGAHELHRPCCWVPAFSTFNLALECTNWINNKYDLRVKEEE